MWKRLLASSILAVGCHREPPATPPALPAPQPEHVAPVDPASRLPDGVQPVAYAIELEIAPESPGFGGHVRIDVQLARAVDSILLHAQALELVQSRVATAGKAASATPRSLGRAAGSTSLDLSEPIGPGAASIHIDFKGTFDAHLRGLYKVESGGQRLRVHAVRGDRRAPGVSVLRRAALQDAVRRHAARAAGAHRDRQHAGRPADAARRRVGRAALRRTEKLPTYLVAFAVGPLDVVDAPPIAPNDRARAALPLRGVAARGRGAELAYALEETPRARREPGALLRHRLPVRQARHHRGARLRRRARWRTPAPSPSATRCCS